MAEPGVLTLGVLAGCGFAAILGLFLRPLSAQESGDLGNADCAHDGRERGQMAFEQHRDFLDCAALEHLLETSVAAPEKRFAFGQQDRGMQRDVLADSAGPLGLPVRERAAGRADDLERAGYPGGIAGLSAAARTGSSICRAA